MRHLSSHPYSFKAKEKYFRTDKPNRQGLSEGVLGVRRGMRSVRSKAVRNILTSHSYKGDF